MITTLSNRCFLKFAHAFLLVVQAGMMLNCAQGNCRSQRTTEVVRTNESIKMESENTGSQRRSPDSEDMETIQVYKSDESRQCDSSSGVTLDKMKTDLAGIKVISSRKERDGLFRIQKCGSLTGMSNVYKIEKSNLSEAKKKGFKEWLW